MAGKITLKQSPYQNVFKNFAGRNLIDFKTRKLLIPCVLGILGRC